MVTKVLRAGRGIARRSRTERVNRVCLWLEPLEDRSLPSTVASGLERPPEARADREITVMTRNLYLGADLDPVAAAAATGDLFAIIGAVSTAWGNVLATNFPERAEALAAEVAQAQPLLVGLQEVTLFRTGDPDSLFGNPTQASHVEFDYLEILLHALDERGQHYAPVAVTQEFDAEFPGFTAPGVLQDIRLTDRDVILARTDLPASGLKLSNVQTANYATNVSFPIGGTGLSVTLFRGWGSVDAKVRGKTFRFVNTHLEPESANPLVNAVQVAQASELLNGPANTALPVVLVGDYNSRADGTGTLTYSVLIGAGFTDVWSATHAGELGNTCCQDANLLNPTSKLDQRIDLVLFRGDLRAFDSDIVGEELANRTPSGLWPSDHAGVVATLGLHIRPQQAEVGSAGTFTALTVGVDAGKSSSSGIIDRRIAGTGCLPSQTTASLLAIGWGPTSQRVLKLAIGSSCGLAALDQLLAGLVSDTLLNGL